MYDDSIFSLRLFACVPMYEMGLFTSRDKRVLNTET